MRFTCVAVCGLGIFMALGCRTVPPEVKPVKQPEVCNVPPPEVRYEQSIYPKEAFHQPNFKKKDDSGVMPARMGGSGPGMGPGMMNQGARQY